MAETEVESILREIRERVLSQSRSAEVVAASAAARSAMANGTNGSGGQQGISETVAAENLALINSYLTTTGRTWDRLPPLVSNRSGLVARLELWLKRRLSAGTRWFTWEQVNFNAAVHHALRDTLQVLSAYEQELQKLQAKIDAEAEALQGKIAVEVEALRAKIDAEGQALQAKIDAEAEARRVEFEQHPPRAEMNARLAEVVSEFRERDERLQDQQRVCFKQLTLETSEAAVLEDRARRKSAALLEELRGRVEQLEKE